MRLSSRATGCGDIRIDIYARFRQESAANKKLKRFKRRSNGNNVF